MKRVLVTILSILYIASATGATVHIHYCMGKFMSASLIRIAEDKCSKCGMKKTLQSGCCKDEHKTFNTSEHQLAKASFHFSHQQVCPSYVPVYSFRNYPVYATVVNDIAGVHAPPFYWRTCPIYIRVRNFRI
jgi:hypothetical protein